MSFLDAFKDSALNVYHATLDALHATFANTLIQAGHAVTPTDHADVLVASALSVAAAVGKPQASSAAPNYADHALVAFNQGTTRAMLQFAANFLPAKLAPVAQAVAAVVADPAHAVAGLASAAEAVGVAALEAAVPGAAPFVEALSPVVDAAVQSASAEVAKGVESVIPADAAPSSTEPATPAA